MEIPQITVQELHKLFQANWPGNTLLLDVRGKGEFRAMSIPGAVNIPLNEVEDAVDELSKYNKIYVQCHSGGRSQMACMLLAAKGLHNTMNVAGGIRDWIDNGYPVD